MLVNSCSWLILDLVILVFLDTFTEGLKQWVRIIGNKLSVLWTAISKWFKLYI